MTKTQNVSDHFHDASVPIDGMPRELIETSINKEVDADLPPSQNFGTFATTKFDPAISRLVLQSVSRNQACVEEYPSIAR